MRRYTLNLQQLLLMGSYLLTCTNLAINLLKSNSTDSLENVVRFLYKFDQTRLNQSVQWIFFQQRMLFVLYDYTINNSAVEAAVDSVDKGELN